MRTDIVMGLVTLLLGFMLVPLAFLQAPSPLYINCTPIGNSSYLNCQTVTPSIFPTLTTIPRQTTSTSTPSPTLLPSGLDFVYQTATQHALRLTSTPGYNASTALAIPTLPPVPSPTQELWGTPVITRPLPTATPATSPYVVTALQGIKVRACPATTCTQVGGVGYGSVIWVAEVQTAGSYLWGKIADGQWVALRSANSAYIFVRDGYQ